LTQNLWVEIITPAMEKSNLNSPH